MSIKNNIALVVVMIIISSINLRAQQLTQYSNYFVNSYMINPALAGHDGITNAYFIRNQKNLGFDGGNVANILTIDGSIFNNKIGLGITINNDQMGASVNQGGYLTFSYAVKLSEENKLGFGFSGGIADKRFDLSNAIVQDLNDPMLQMGFPSRKSYFDGIAGLYLDIKKIQFGIAIPQIIGNKIILSESQTRLSRHYTAHLKYDFLFNEKNGVSLVPFARMVYIPSAPFQYDLNLKLDMKKIGWVNFAWRSNYAFSGSIGFRIKENIMVGYSYHVPMNSTKNYGTSNQEILFGISFGSGGKRDQKALDDAKRENDRLMLENAKMENERDSLMKLKTKAEVDLRNEKTEQQKLLDSIAAINEKNQGLLDENNRLSKENEELKKLIEELKKSSGTKTVEIPDPKAKEEADKLRKENDKLKNEIESLKTNQSGNNNVTADPKIKEENKKLKDENEKLKKEIESLNSGNSSNDQVEKFKKENEKLQKQIEEMKKDAQNNNVSNNNNSDNTNTNSNTTNTTNNSNNTNTNSNTTNTNNNSNNTSFTGDIRKSVNDHFYELDKTTEASKGFYVVSGAFGKIEFAENWLEKNKSNFPDAKLIYNTRNNLHYIILGYSVEKTEVYDVFYKGKKSGIDKIWILNYE